MLLLLDETTQVLPVGIVVCRELPSHRLYNAKIHPYLALSCLLLFLCHPYIPCCIIRRIFLITICDRPREKGPFVVRDRFCVIHTYALPRMRLINPFFRRAFYSRVMNRYAQLPHTQWNGDIGKKTLISGLRTKRPYTCTGGARALNLPRAFTLVQCC